MWIDLDLQLGLHGMSRPFASLWLDRSAIHSEAQLLGAYHILAMGRHYDDYLVTPFLPTLPPVVGYPTTAHPYMMVSGKVRAAGVTGNIGEAVAAIFARRVLELAIGDIVHIRPVRPFARRKAPDYVLRAGASVQASLSIVWPAALTITAPTWWPLESKARTTPNSAEDGKREALAQLAAYWHSIRRAQPNDVGFGFISTLIYRSPKRVLVSVFVPRDRAALIAKVDSMSYRAFTADFASEPALRSTLHGC